MRNRIVIRGLATSGLIALALAAGMPTARGQEPAPLAPTVVRSLSEPGEALALRASAERSALTTFATAPGQGILLTGVTGAPAAERALAFVNLYGRAFGIQDRFSARVLRAPAADALGFEHVRLQQLHDGVPVTAGELIVHLRGDRVLGANGRTLASFPGSVVPALDPAGAQNAAAALMAKRNRAVGVQYGEPRLEVFNRGLIDEGAYPTRLAWFVEVTGDALRQFVWVDAETGAVLLDFSQLADAKDRRVHDMGHSSNQAQLPGTLVRSEGQGPSGDADVNDAYDFAGLTYDYYLAQHARDSYDGLGSPLISSVHFGTNYQNAFWNGTQMVYGDGFASADDVVSHELTHAVTEYSANLLYYNQSGALNESFSDIFGETVDLTDGVGTDTAGVRWLMGEDLAVFGAIRNMMNPNAFGDPGKMSDPQLFCRSDGWTNPNGDSGGVHINSGIPNHAYALMVDGGSYNGQTVTGIGLAKAGKIQYRALTTYLTSGSGFADNAAALTQACSDLIGTAGITAGDCAQVTAAIAAVEMTSPFACPGATPPPATLCPIGGSPNAVFTDGFETGIGSWTATSTTAANWDATTGFAKTGLASAYGVDVTSTADQRMTMTNPVTIPAGGRVYFDHAFEFEHVRLGTDNYDGGVLEYSTDGTTWNDANALIDGGQAYNGTLDAGNALGARTAFVRSSFGYTGTRLNVASLAGQNVRFRFRLGTDSSVGSLGWLVDNFRIYSCGGATPGPQPPTDLRVLSISGTTVTFAWALPTAGDTPTGIHIEGGSGPGSVLGAADLPVSNTFTVALPASTWYVRVKTIAGAAQSAASPDVIVHLNGAVPPATPTNFVGLVTGSNLNLTWKNPLEGTPTTGGRPSAVVLNVTGSLTTSLALGPTESFSYAGVPAGTYTFTVQTANAAGLSAPSAPVTLTFPTACSGVPQAPTGFFAYKSGSTVIINWDPPAAGAAPTLYTLNVTGSFTGGFSTPGRAFAAAAPPGTYNLSVSASNPCGTGPATAVQTITIP
ncbi:MAG: M4 family metallopeptidase [Vicinamibacterales bacterium]